MQYLGDYVEDDTVYFLFNTNDASGASITRATDGTISVYKDNGTTQSTAGVTTSEDFDSLTGVHSVTIDTSADAFYATGADYAVVLSGSTIDGQTVNAVLAHFSIQNRYMRGTDSANTTTPPTAAAIRSEIDSNSTQLAAIVADTNELQTDNVPGLIAALNDLDAAGVRNAVGLASANLDTQLSTIDTAVDTLADDLFTTADAEPGQGTPASNASPMTKLAYLYKAWRNKTDNDGSTTQLYDSSGATVDQKQTTGESGGTVTKGTWTTGP